MSRIIYGKGPVSEALKYIPQQVRRIVADTAKKKAMRDFDTLATSAGHSIEWVNAAVVEKLAGRVNHQGIACVADDFQYTSLREYLAQKPNGPRLVVLCDHWEDPQNIGNALRSMGGFGGDLLVLPKHGAAPVSPTVVKVSAGAAGLVPVARESSQAQSIELLKKNGFWVYGLEGDGDTLLQDQDFRGDVALVIGSEGKGLSDLVRKNCDVVCRIPLTGPLGSLNAATALACGLYEVIRQRQIGTVAPTNAGQAD